MLPHFHVLLKDIAFFSISILLVAVGTDVDADMAVSLAKTGNRVAFIDIRQPAFDAVGGYEIIRDGVAGTVRAAEIAVQALILRSKFDRRVIRRREVGGHEARPEVGTQFRVNQAAITAKFAKSHFVQYRDRLDLIRPVMVRQRRIPQFVTDIAGNLGRHTGASCIDLHRLDFDRQRAFKRLGVIFVADDRDDILVRQIDAELDEIRNSDLPADRA
jgi:hypothetical protein